MLGLWLSAFGAYGDLLGHVMELEGRKEFIDTG